MVTPECARPAGLRAIRQLPRRPVLLGLTAGVLAAPTTTLLAGCGGGQPDPLELLASRARSDAALIDSLLAQPTLAAALSDRLTPVADARRQHAVALGVELGESSSASQTSTPSSTAPAASTKPDAEDALARVRAALDSSFNQAARLVLTLPRRRAALVGSIAACCAAYRAVLQ